MREQEESYWFPAKRYGWGWGLPHRWQGWVVLAIYAALVLTAVYALQPEHEPLRFLLGIAIPTVALVAVCWLKGEPARWRWGEDGSSKDK